MGRERKRDVQQDSELSKLEGVTLEQFKKKSCNFTSRVLERKEGE